MSRCHSVCVTLHRHSKGTWTLFFKIVFSRTIEDHENHLKTIMKILESSKLLISTDKCIRKKSKVQFLGFHICSNEIKQIESRVKAITTLTPLADAKTLRGFIGAATFYQWMIHRLSEIMSPLHDLLASFNKHKKKLIWLEHHQVLFDKV